MNRGGCGGGWLVALVVSVARGQGRAVGRHRLRERP
jgi:hypothetical protein